MSAGITAGEVQNIAFAAANEVAKRVEKHIDDKVEELTKTSTLAIELHAASCPTKKVVNDRESRRKGAMAAWAMVTAAAAIIGGTLGPLIKEALARALGGG